MAEIIREAFRNSGLSIKKLSERSGVGYASCHGFVNGTRDLTLESAAQICEVLGLELKSTRRKR